MASNLRNSMGQPIAPEDSQSILWIVLALFAIVALSYASYSLYRESSYYDPPAELNDTL